MEMKKIILKWFAVPLVHTKLLTTNAFTAGIVLIHFQTFLLWTNQISNNEIEIEFCLFFFSGNTWIQRAAWSKWNISRFNCSNPYEFNGSRTYVRSLFVEDYWPINLFLYARKIVISARWTNTYWSIFTSSHLLLVPSLVSSLASRRPSSAC